MRQCDSQNSTNVKVPDTLRERADAQSQAGSIALSWSRLFVVILALAWRNLWRYRRRTLITASTIVIGMVLAIFFIGIGDGSHQAMVRQAIALGEGHITVQPVGYLAAPNNQLVLSDGIALKAHLEQLELPAHITPRLALQVLASTAYQSEGVQLIGIESHADPLLAQLTKHTPIKGEFLADTDSQGVWIGQALAQRLRVDIGGKIVVLAGRQGADALSHLFRVKGIFRSGVTDLDRYVMVSTLSGAHHLLAEDPATVVGAVTRLAIFLSSDTALQDHLHRIKHRVLETSPQPESVAVLPWQEMMPELVQFIAIDDAGNYVFLSLILVLIIFGIVNTVLMSVLERTREFGLLCALGLRPAYLWLLVATESFLLGVLSCVVGWVFGACIHYWFATKGLDLSGLMASGAEVMGTVMEPVIYADLSWARVLQLTAIVMLATLASGLYPAIKAARVSPLQAMRT